MGSSFTFHVCSKSVKRLIMVFGNLVNLPSIILLFERYLKVLFESVYEIFISLFCGLHQRRMNLRG